jgi:hypothetical protein
MRFIKHEDSVDLCYNILNWGDYDVLLETWNMGQTSPFDIGHTFTIPINKILDGRWLVCENSREIVDMEISLRRAKWTKLKI